MAISATDREFVRRRAQFACEYLGIFSLQLLHLNRLPLIEYRQKRQQEQENLQALTRLQALVQVYEQLLEQQAQLITEQHVLLEKQQALLQHFIGQTLK